MANTTTASVNALGCDDPPLDLSNFFDEAERFSVIDYVFRVLASMGTFLKKLIQYMMPRAADHDDSIVADLPTFLEMATFEDPIDDLAVSLENACRWACRKREVGPEGTFYLFVELPCEIRLMIWRQCIPSQVHLVAERAHKDFVGPIVRGNHRTIHIMDEVQEDFIADPSGYQGRYCNTAHPSPCRQRTPVIAKVNHEARTISLEGRSKRHNLAFVRRGVAGWFGRIQESPVWLDEKRDTVLINTNYIPATRHPTSSVLVNKNHKFDHKADTMFGMVTRNRIQVAIFAAALIDTDAPTRLYHALTKADRVQVVVGVFRFDDMSDSEACVTDLFGPFGEESMALVPVSDPRSLRRLFMAHAAFRPDCANEFFNWDEGEDMRIHMSDRYQDWNVRRRPSDFDAYCEEMRGFAFLMMRTCEELLMSRPFEGANREAEVRRWETKVKETFKKTFEPVFLVHRCRNAVLINSKHMLGGL